MHLLQGIHTTNFSQVEQIDLYRSVNNVQTYQTLKRAIYSTFVLGSTAVCVKFHNIQL